MAKLDAYLQRKANVLAARQAEFTAQPSTATTVLEVRCHVAGNSGVRPVKMGDYIVVTDSAAGLAGHSLGPTSPQMLLGALASCLAHTYLLQAALHQIALDAVAINTSGEVNFADVVNKHCDRPLAMDNISFRAAIDTPESAQRLAFLHSEVENACVVLNTLRYATAVTRIAG